MAALGDFVIEKRKDAQYDMWRIGDGGTRERVREAVGTLDEARRIARTDAADRRVWYRDWSDPPDYLEPL